MRFLAINRSPIWIIGLILVAFVWFEQRQAYLHLRNPYVVTGWALFLLMSFLAVFNWRKKLSMLPLGRARDWLPLHVVGGLVAVAFFWMHVGDVWPRGAYERCLAALFYAVSITGMIGYVLLRVYPPYLTRTGVEIIYERIPKELSHLREQAQALVLQCTDATGSDTLGRQYLENLDWYFRRPRFVWNHAFAGNKGKSWVRQQRNTVARYLNDSERVFLDKLFKLATYKNDIDFHYTAQSIMKGWLLVHLPLAAAAMVLGIWHVVLVHIYAL